jgi:predicted phage terminase large subunit-like protein
MVEDARRDDFKWRTLYQQRPPSESGDWVSREEIQLVAPTNSPDTPMSYYLLTDLALSVNKGDYSVHLVVGVDKEQNVHVVDAWRDRCAIDKTVEVHLNLASAYPLAESLIDDDNAAKVYVQLLATRARERGVAVPWKAMPMRGQDKETRAAPLRGLFKRRKVFMRRAPWNEWMVRELLIFPNAMGEGVDDGVDALGLIGRRLTALASPAPAPAAPKPLPGLHQMTLDGLYEENERGRSSFGRGRLS